MKAALLFSFFRFVEWPEDFSDIHTSELTLGIVGRDPIDDHLPALVGRKWAGGRPIVIKHFQDEHDLKPTNILFISNQLRENIPELLRAIKGQPVLTVGDFAEFVEEGGIISFTAKGNKVRFQINKRNAAVLGIRISDELLKLADEVL